MAKRSCGIRSLPLCGATVVTKGDETLDASATGERGAGTNSGVSIAPLTTGPLVGPLASWLCSTKLSDGAIAKTPTPNPARIKANPTTLLMTNHLHQHLRAPRDDFAHRRSKPTGSVFDIRWPRP